MDHKKILTYSLIGIFVGLFTLSRFIPLWSFILLVVTLAVGGYLLDRFFLAHRRERRTELDAAELLERLESGTGDLRSTDDGILTITFRNETDRALRMHPYVALQYAHLDGVPASGSSEHSAISLRTLAAKPVHIDAGETHRYELLEMRSTSVPVAREEHLYHPKLMPFLEESGGVFALLREQPDIYSLKCTFNKSGVKVTRSLRLDGSQRPTTHETGSVSQAAADLRDRGQRRRNLIAPKAKSLGCSLGVLRGLDCCS